MDRPGTPRDVTGDVRWRTCRRKGLSVGASADCFSSRKMSSAAFGGVQEGKSGGVVR